jgi:hypothetical protein
MSSLQKLYKGRQLFKMKKENLLQKKNNSTPKLNEVQNLAH